MLDRRDDAGGAPRPAATAPAPQAVADPITPVDNSGFDDDIPF